MCLPNNVICFSSTSRETERERAEPRVCALQARVAGKKAGCPLQPPAPVHT